MNKSLKPMFKRHVVNFFEWLGKSPEPCAHPLDSIEVKGNVITSPSLAKNGNEVVTNHITFICKDCSRELDRSWDSLTPEGTNALFQRLHNQALLLEEEES